MRGIEQIPWAYDLFMEVADRTGLQKLRHALARQVEGRILDLGCGTGRNLRLFEMTSKVTGLELEFGLLARAHRRAPHVPLVIGRAEELPFQSGCFDTVVSSLVFCSVADPNQGLAEVSRVLDEAGDLRMLEHVRSTNRLLAWCQDRIQPFWTWLTGGCHPNRETEASVAAAGFVIEEHEIRGRTTLRCFVARPRKTGPEVD